MGESAEHETIGQLFLALYEMGFEESQVQAALRAGCFMVQDAADWIIQKEQRGTLRTRRGTETGPGAVAAFNPPLDRGNPCDAPAPRASPEAELHPLSRTGYSQHRREFEERQAVTLAREVQEEKRSKKKDRDLVLQRISEDRQQLQEKVQSIAPHRDAASRSKECAEPDTGCALMVRLPSGSSVRLQFAADALLLSVCDHLDSTQPSLAPCSLLQTFPTRHFTEQDLRSSLQELGLTPNATLRVRPRDKPCSMPQPESTADPSPEAMDTLCSPDDLMVQGNQLLPIMRSPAYSVAPDVQMRDVPPLSQPHTWGRGQRLVRQDQDEAGGDAAAVGGIDQFPVVSRAVGSPSHQWPSDGVRLRQSAQSNESGTPGSPSAEPDPPNLRARMAAELRQESPEKVPSVSRGVRVSAIPSLRHLALQEAIILINAPSMQYSRSLSGMTPELAELIIDHMIKERVLRPRALELFTGCPIRSLTLNCYPYCTNDLLRHLRGFTNIRKLSLSSCTLITDQGLSVVQFLHKLQYVNVSSCRKLTDSFLPFLVGLEHLSHLVLDQTKVSDDGLCDFLLQSRGSLTHLSVNQTSVTERTLSILSQRVPELKLLSIKHTQVSDVSSLRELKQLNSLHVDNTQVTETSLLAAASLSRLSTLTLSGVQSLTSDRVLELVSGLSLTRLVLPGRRCLTDDGLSNLGGLRSLVELNLMDHTHITDRGVQHISLLTRLQILSLCNTSVSDSGLIHLRGLRHLEELSLDRTKVTSRGVSQCVPHLPHLQVLGLSDTAVGDNVLKHGIRHCRDLLKVNLSRTRVTDKGLRFLKAVSIVQLNLDGTGVSLQGVSDLMASCVSILSVRANNLRQIPRVDVSDEE